MEDNKNINCYLYIPNNNDDDNIQWMKIKNVDNDNVLFNIPYINKYKTYNINSFEKAAYKTALLMEDTLDYQIESVINHIYDNYTKIIYSKKIELKYHIDLTKSTYTYTQLYFLNKLSRIGFIHHIDSTKVIFEFPSIIRHNI